MLKPGYVVVSLILVLLSVKANAQDGGWLFKYDTFYSKISFDSNDRSYEKSDQLYILINSAADAQKIFDKGIQNKVYAIKMELTSFFK